MEIFEINIKVPGLNGTDGLIREHFFRAKRRKELYQHILLLQKNKSFKGVVNIIYERYTCRLMDWDNHCASFKHIGDALVKIGVIKDDNPSIVQNFTPRQIKVNTKKEEKIIIKIEDAGDEPD